MLEMLLLAMNNPEDEEKFTQIYNDYSKLVFYIANEFFDKKEDVEEAAYEALLKVALNLDKIADDNTSEIEKNRTKRFIKIITKNTCITMYNKNKKIKEVGFDELSETSLSYNNIDENISRQISKDIYAKAMMKMPEKYYEILYLFYYEGLSHKDIADKLCITVNASVKRTKTAKNYFIKLVEEDNEDGFEQ